MSALKRPAIHQRPRETADDLDDRRRADPAGALCAHTGAIEGGLRLHYRDGRVTDLQGNPIKTQGESKAL